MRQHAGQVCVKKKLTPKKNRFTFNVLAQNVREDTDWVLQPPLLTGVEAPPPVSSREGSYAALLLY